VQPRTVREVIYHHYAKFIASAMLDVKWQNIPDESLRKRYWGLVRDRYSRLLSGEIAMSSSSKEFKMLVEDRGSSCIYCGSTDSLEWDHIIPLARGGPDTPDNLVRACATCNRSKGSKTPSEFYAGRWDQIPRIVQGLYLKLLYAEHERGSTLDATEFPSGEKPRISVLARVFETSNAAHPLKSGRRLGESEHPE